MKRSFKIPTRFWILGGVLVALFYFGCPFYQLFRIRCPACGLTRAWIYFLKGAWHHAFEEHVLFLFAPAFLILVVWRDAPTVKKHYIADSLLFLFAFLMVAYHIYRS